MELINFIEQKFHPMLRKLPKKERSEMLQLVSHCEVENGSQLNKAVREFENKLQNRLLKGSVPHLDEAYQALRKKQPLADSHRAGSWARQVEDACKETLRRFLAGIYEAWEDSRALKAFYEAYSDRINTAYEKDESPIDIMHAVLSPLRTVDMTDYRRIDGTTIRNAHKSLNVSHRRGRNRVIEEDDEYLSDYDFLSAEEVNEKRCFFPPVFADEKALEACLQHNEANCDLDGCDEDGRALIRLSVGDGLGQWAIYRPYEHGYSRVFKA